MAAAYATRSATNAWATRPCCDKAATAWAVMDAWCFAWVMTKTKGLSASFTCSTVSATAHKSDGEGRTGMSTKSATSSNAVFWFEMVGAVSMKQYATSLAVRVARPSAIRANGTSRRWGYLLCGAHATGSRWLDGRYRLTKLYRRHARLPRPNVRPALFCHCRLSAMQ